MKENNFYFQLVNYALNVLAGNVLAGKTINQFETIQT